MDAVLDTTIPNQVDFDFARRHAPHLRFDAREPFLPSIVGYTVFRTSGKSPSFPREITLPQGAACAIEYAIWWDWEIQHLYELEHLWIYLDANDHLIAAEGSQHGGLNDLENFETEDGHLVAYSETGKHAFSASPQIARLREETTRQECGLLAGKDGVLVTPLFEGLITSRNPIANRAVHSYLECLAFEPSFEFSKPFDLAQATFVPWQALFEYIPKRVAWCVEQVKRMFPVNRQHLYKIAHRGASAYAPENSLEAFAKAAEMGADLVEIDIRITLDGVPVVSHDSTLKRVFGVDGVIAEKTLAELRALTPPGVEPIPTFDDVAHICAVRGLGLYLDIKDYDDNMGRKVLESLDRYNLLNWSIAGSFDLDTLVYLKALEPRLMTSILFGAVTLDPVGLAQSIGADYVHPCWERHSPQPHTLLTPEWVARVHEAGYGIVCWHEERSEEIAALRALGVDAICSDTPDRLAVHKTICAD